MLHTSSVFCSVVAADMGEAAGANGTEGAAGGAGGGIGIDGASGTSELEDETMAELEAADTAAAATASNKLAGTTVGSSEDEISKFEGKVS